MTLFPMFDVPVFWPILLLYWLLLFTVTMKRQIKHMIKYRYLPFSTGKKVGALRLHGYSDDEGAASATKFMTCRLARFCCHNMLTPCAALRLLLLFAAIRAAQGGGFSQVEKYSRRCRWV